VRITDRYGKSEVPTDKATAESNMSKFSVRDRHKQTAELQKCDGR